MEYLYNVSALQGLTFSKVYQAGETIKFVEQYTGRVFTMEHMQSCCESVYIESIVGDLSDLEDTRILLAEESYKSGSAGEYGDSETWTFYKFATRKGYVDIRWYGTSNGYYSESVTITVEKEE